jgi:hypothetical protein
MLVGRRRGRDLTFIKTTIEDELLNDPVYGKDEERKRREALEETMFLMRYLSKRQYGINEKKKKKKKNKGRGIY